MFKRNEKRIRHVFDDKSLEYQLAEIDREINCLLLEKEELQGKSQDRIKQIKAWEDTGNIKILGSMCRNGKKKCLLFIIRYPDETQKETRWESDKIAELRKLLLTLKEQYRGDWSGFNEKLS